MPSKKQKITSRSLLELKMPGEVRVSPEGERVVFSVSETDWDENRVAQQLYVVGIDGSAPARQMTRGKADASEPRWSPDGRWLAFLSAREEDAGAGDDYEDEDDAPRLQVWLLPMDGGGGEAEKLSHAPEGIGAYEWLPDSSGIVYLAREPRAAPLQAAREDRQERKDDAEAERAEKFRQQIWRIGLDDKKPKLLHSGDLGIGELVVSPDGLWVAYTTNYTGEENDYHLADVWVLELITGKTRQLTDGPGGKFHPVWRPDSQAVLFTRSLDPTLSFSQENLFQVCVSDRAVACLTERLPYDLTGWHGIWYGDGEMLYVAAAVGTTTGIFAQAEGEQSFEEVILNQGHVHDFHPGRHGNIAFIASSATQPPEVLWLAGDSDEPETLTDLNGEWLEKYALAETQLISYESEAGVTIDALLTRPPGEAGTEPYPLIVNVHGGPHGRAVQALTPYSVAQVWASEGYAVLSPNYRGSEGYGEAFGLATRGDLGGADYEDILAAVQWAAVTGLTDGEHLGIIGSSYGAFLVNWVIARTTLFKAAVSQFGISSLATDFSNSQAPRWDMEYLGGHPWEIPDIYARLSPASQIHQVQTPVLLMHGEGDSNTFIANSQEMYQALRLQNRRVEFVRYPREGHGFFEPQHRLDEMQRVLAWFDTYVRDDGERSAYRIGERVVRDGWELIVTEAARASYRGRSSRTRYLEVTFSLRDVQERRLPLTLRPQDVVLHQRAGNPPGTPIRPAGLPVEALGGKVLAQARAWRFVFAPGKDERGLAVALTLAFPAVKRAGTYHVTVTGFPPVAFDISAEDEGKL